MFCGKCGARIETNEKFCGSCGEKAAVNYIQQGNQTQSSGNIQNGAGFNFNKIGSLLGANAKLFFAVVGLFILQFILFFQTTFSANLLGQRTEETSIA